MDKTGLIGIVQTWIRRHVDLEHAFRTKINEKERGQVRSHLGGTTPGDKKKKKRREGSGNHELLLLNSWGFHCNLLCVKLW